MDSKDSAMPLDGDSDTPLTASEIGGHWVPSDAEVWIRRDQTRKVVEALRGERWEHDTEDESGWSAAAEFVERKFGAP